MTILEEIEREKARFTAQNDGRVPHQNADTAAQYLEIAGVTIEAAANDATGDDRDFRAASVKVAALAWLALEKIDADK